MGDLERLEKLFNRFKQLDVQNLAAIVQNPMSISDEDLNNWIVNQVAPVREDFDRLITDVVLYYSKLKPCSWCGERHPGGPENCQN